MREESQNLINFIDLTELVLFMRVNCWTANLMGMERIIIQMEGIIKALFLMAFLMVMADSSIRMEIIIKVMLNLEEETAKVIITLEKLYFTAFSRIIF